VFISVYAEKHNFCSALLRIGNSEGCIVASSLQNDKQRHALSIKFMLI